MKAIQAIVVILLVSGICYSQNEESIASTNNKTFTKVSKKKKAKKKKKEVIEVDYADEHSRFVSMQLRNYLLKNTPYPAMMKENCIEGKVLIKVQISDKGEVLKTEVVESPHRSFSQAVLNSMDKIQYLGIHQRTYQGKSIIYVPIHFFL